MVNVNSKSAARKRVREAQLRANETRVERERRNVDDAASFLVELGRLAAVDEWEETRILEIRAEAERRRHEHRLAGAAAVARMQGRGETLSAIAELAGVKVGDVRAVVKATSAPTGAARDALGEGLGAAVAQALGPNDVTAQADDAAAEALGEGLGAAASGAAARALGSNDLTAPADGASAYARDANGAALHDEDVGGRA